MLPIYPSDLEMYSVLVQAGARVGKASGCSVGREVVLMTPQNFWAYGHWGRLLREAGDQTLT